MADPGNRDARNPPRLGFLGTGWIGLHRMQRIAESGAAEVAIICDSSPDMLAQAAKNFPTAKQATSFDEILGFDLDGLVIATPSALHAEQTLRALDQGLAVFCQKPLGRNALEVASVVHKAQAVNRLLGVDLSYRFTEAMRHISAKLSAGEIGEVYACELVFHNAYGPDKPWFYDRELSGGGCVIDLGIHLLDLALWALGFPEATEVSSSLFAKGKPLVDGEVEDYATATLRLNSGAVVRLACSWRLPVGYEALISAVFYGTKGGLSLSNVNGSFYDFVAEQFRGTSRVRLASPPDDWGGRAAIVWTKQLSTKACFDPDIVHAIYVAQLLDAIYAAGNKSHSIPAPRKYSSSGCPGS